MAKSVQLPLFDTPTLNVSVSFKKALHAAVDNSGMPPKDIVQKMNELAANYGACLGQGKATCLTEDAFVKWINHEDLSRNMPVKALPIFCAVLRNFEPLQALVKPLGLELIASEDQEKLRWADAKLQVKKLNRIASDAEAKIMRQ